ncbi:HNH endonuclease [Paenarthrobacter sp. YIM B13468]|uniref:HNH endonuclease n=1 Tax=Paenarthrobacter sp. YIM B13468 TaxID=3366295 RepID=UPI00366C8F6C
MSYDGQTETDSKNTDAIYNPEASDRSPGAHKNPADMPGNQGQPATATPKKALQGQATAKPKKACALDGADKPVNCGKPIHARKRCKTHYQQWLRKQIKCRVPGCNRVKAAHYLCRTHERLALSERSPEAQAETLMNFRLQIEPDPVTGCWLWTGTKNPKGYGHSGTVGGTWLAHRFAYVWFCGGHAPGKVLDHICNVVHCVRPDHLWAITNTENLRLMHERAAADDKEFWRHTRTTPVIDSMIIWAIDNGLPYLKPEPSKHGTEAPKTLVRVQLALAA